MAQQSEAQEFTKTVPVHRPEGVNASERYLAKLCDRSFLSLWSYPSLTRDQGRANGREGKELCDLLVVFGNHVLIFQDKHCEFKDSGDLKLDWSRWYRNAVEGGAKQIWGAEKWIKEHPDLIFMDRSCTQPFPFVLPEPDTAQYHRIIVAHGAAERCKQELGGSGSLMIMADAVGPVTSGADIENLPFATGQIDPSKGFVHVFDDTTLDVALQTLDTINDFTSYLTKKEAFVSAEWFLSAAGEEELLAAYLTKMNPDGEHDFVFPANTFVVLDEGGWSKFCKNSRRIAQLKANQISYLWDALIEEFNRHNLAGTQHFVSHSLKETEVALRFLAGENRTSRRLLSEELHEIFQRTPSDERAVRVTKSPFQDGVYYVFMLFPHFKQGSEEENRLARRTHLMHYCMVVKLKCPDANHIVGVATEAGMLEYSSEDLAYYNASVWSEEEQAAAKSVQKEFNILNTVRTFQGMVYEYPDVDGTSRSHNGTGSSSAHMKPKRIGRNNTCPCGSGMKYKKCHGK